jgi:hypothetical protein
MCGHCQKLVVRWCREVQIELEALSPKAPCASTAKGKKEAPSERAKLLYLFNVASVFLALLHVHVADRGMERDGLEVRHG